MAYVAGEHRLQIRGALGPTESWNNTWTVFSEGDVGDIADAVEAFHDYYGVLSARLSDNWTAVGCSVKDLFTGALTEGTWATIDGQSGNDMLPSECALRYSLTAADNVRGGPFICGWQVGVLDNLGTFEDAIIVTMMDELDVLNDALVAADFRIAIDRPTTQTTRLAQTLRVGHTFDVIRKRRNDTPEAYSTNILG